MPGDAANPSPQVKASPILQNGKRATTEFAANARQVVDGIELLGENGHRRCRTRV
jgi:hypothetical protein